METRSDHARQRSRPSGASWEQEGAFYGQEVLRSGFTIGFKVVMQGFLEGFPDCFAWQEGEEGV